MQITTNGARVINGQVIAGDPALDILADDVVFFNQNGGELRSSGASAIQIRGARNRIVNEAGGVVQATTNDTVAIAGSAFDDVIENAGVIGGRINLGDGADRFVHDGGGVSGAIDFGGGDDALVVRKNTGFLSGTMQGGAGIDTLIYETTPLYNIVTASFERLVAQLSPTQTWNTTIQGDFNDISLTATNQRGWANLLDTQLSQATISIDGVGLTLGYGTVVKNVVGSANADSLEFASAPAYAAASGTVTGFADLGGGDDSVSFMSFDGRVMAPDAPVRGGAGTDTIYFSVNKDAQVDLKAFSGFERVLVGANFSSTAVHTIVNLPDVQRVITSSVFGADFGQTVIAKTDRPGTIIEARSYGVVTIAADATVGRIIDPAAEPANPFTAGPQTVVVAGRVAGDVDLRGENDVVRNSGRIDGTVLLGDGADRYTETLLAASVGGTVEGGADNDRFDLLLGRANAAVRFDGGAGVDLVSFAAGGNAVSLDLAAGTAADSVGTISTPGFENAAGTNQGDTLFGSAEANRVEGLAGDDLIDGRDGDDLLFGNAGNDTLIGGTGSDTLVGDEGNDALHGGDGDDRLDPGRDRNVVVGGNGEDTLVLGGVQAAYSMIRVGSELIFRTDNEAYRVAGVETVAFADRPLSTAALLAQAQSFDALAYTASYADLRAAFGTNASAATQHYLAAGFAEGRTASFDGLRYVASYRDLVAAIGVDPSAGAAHYIRFGAAEGRSVSFDALRYVASYGDLISAYGLNLSGATEHYIRYGAAEGRAASFDGLRYVASYRDLINVYGLNDIAATEHYVRFGASEGRTANFDALRYTATYTDLIGAFGFDEGAAIRHFISHGAAEGRGAAFDPVGYLLGYPDLAAAGLGANGALRHWVTTGLAENRVGDSLFGREQANHLAQRGSVSNDQLQSPADRDWFEVKLAAGESLRLELNTGAFAGHLELHDSAGRLLALDDGTIGNDAFLNFTATAADSYYVVAASNSGAGAYMLSFEPI